VAVLAGRGALLSPILTSRTPCSSFKHQLLAWLLSRVSKAQLFNT
jgi:hypothetical protein